MKQTQQRKTKGGKTNGKAQPIPPNHNQLEERKAPNRAPNRADLFPLVSVFQQTDMRSAISLMEDDLAYQEQEKAIKERRAEIKMELAALAVKYETDGMRYGSYAVYYNGEKTRKTLNVGLLLENGVRPRQIEASYMESKPYVDLRVVDLAKPKGGDKEDSE